MVFTSPLPEVHIPDLSVFNDLFNSIAEADLDRVPRSASGAILRNDLRTAEALR